MRVRRTAGDVDDGFAWQNFLQADGTRWVNASGSNTTPRGARADGNDSGCALCGPADVIHDRLTGNHAVNTIIFQWDRTIYYQNILPFVLLQSVMFVLFNLMAEGGREHLMVFQRDCLQNEVFHCRVCRAKQRFSTTRTLLSTNPDNRWALRTRN